MWSLRNCSVEHVRIVSARDSSICYCSVKLFLPWTKQPPNKSLQLRSRCVWDNHNNISTSHSSPWSGSYKTGSGLTWAARGIAWCMNTGTHQVSVRQPLTWSSFRYLNLDCIIIDTITKSLVWLIGNFPEKYQYIIFL